MTARWVWARRSSAAGAVEADLHERVWPLIEGRDPLAVDALARDLVPYVGHRSTGVEGRANSAIDIALWDLWGRATGQPIAQLLGGFTRPSIRTYNTCAGPGYMKRRRGSGRGTTRSEARTCSTISTRISTARAIWPRSCWPRASRR